MAIFRGDVVPTLDEDETNDRTDGENGSGSAGHLLSLETALDWLCLHLSTDELPRLFTDADIVSGGDEKLSVSRMHTNVVLGNKSANGTNLDIMTTEDLTLATSSTNTTTLNRDITQRNDGVTLKPVNVHVLPEFGLTKKEKMEKMDQNDDNEVAARKQWLLQQYQYEDDDGIVENDEKVVDTNETVTTLIEKSVEERRLDKLENQVREDRESLNDEAANYMRSKYEIADLKKRLKKAEQQAKGLRAKIEKKKAKEAELAKAATMDDTVPDEDEDEEYGGGGGGMFDLFGTSEETDEATDAIAASTITMDETPIVKKYVPPLSADIPNGWSGKTPKEILLEHCRKRKISKPTFSKISDTQNGCMVRLKLKTDILIEHEGPFCTFKDGEQFAATKALYEIAPDLPLYLLLPPVFRGK